MDLKEDSIRSLSFAPFILLIVGYAILPSRISEITNQRFSVYSRESLLIRFRIVIYQY